MNGAEVRTTVLSGWMDRVREFGVDLPQAMTIAGLEPSPRCDKEARIPLASFARMAELVGEASSHPAIGWLIGEEYDLSELGEIGHAVMSARTLGGALRRLTDNFELLQDTSRLNLEANADTATISYRILDPSIWPRHHDALFSLGIIAKIVRLAVPDMLQFAELGFECRKRDTGLRISQNQLAFECEANSIRLPAAMLERAMPAKGADACDLKSLSTKLADMRRRRSARERLAEIIFARLADGEIDQDQLACEIGMSSRTMRRRLANEATSFQQLLDECRMRQAVLEFQARPGASIAEVALRLGYAEHSTFTRAFTRWVGMPPQKYRSDLLSTMH